MKENGVTISSINERRLRDLPVSALVLFGSRAQGVFRKTSDYDIGVLVTNQSVLHNRTERNRLYDSLYDILAAAIDKIVNIDIVFLEEMPAELKAHVVKNGRLFYGSPSSFARFKEREMIMYSDFAPIRKVFQQATLARIT